MNGIEFLESVLQLGQIILLFSGYALYWKLGKIKKERKLTKYETFLRFFVTFGIFVWALSFLALHLW
ncbi:hypothetical protein CM50_10825 [Bacillus subtilis]|nr:hypothetical protein [Bacillus stercoris]KFF56688.1 hypothetical protein CM50_10825 [Bacillus subtilis] [Bacillus stercoris]